MVLGDEFDDSLRGKLMDALRSLGAVQAGGGNRFVVGSQDLDDLDVLIDERSLHIEAETYIGLSISGPADLVEKVRFLVSQ